MKKKYGIDNAYEHENDNNNDVDTLPSRRARHPKPLSFLEKPVFSLIVFLLFLLIIGGIFLYIYIKNGAESSQADNNIASADTNESQSAAPNTDKIEKLLPESKPVPVVNTSEPKVDNINDGSKKVDEPASEEPSANEKSIFTTHIVKNGDTLYNISRAYYGSGVISNINKIKEANGLKDDNIILNSKLIIPEPTRNP